MTTKQVSADFKSVYMVIVTLSMLAPMFTLQPWVYASSNNDDDDDDYNDNDNSDSDNDGGSRLFYSLLEQQRWSAVMEMG
jgi:hypothetical protein